MPNKTWINRVHSAGSRADLSCSISEPNDYVINNSQVEVDLRGNPSDNKTNINAGDVIYIAVNGFYQFADGEKRNSLRIVAKGVVDRIKYRDNIPVAVFVQGSFEHMTAPMINGLDVKRLNKDHRDYESPIQSPYWELATNEANYIDQNIFSGVKSI